MQETQGRMRPGIEGTPLLVGDSSRIQSIVQLIQKMSRGRWPVLVMGETGTGKEVVARSIHQANPVGPFVTIDCSSVVGSLMESELFGHVKGSFTGAVSTKTGLLELANGGTAFLDEIGELPLDLQCYKKRNFDRSDRTRRGALISASSPPPIAIWPGKWRRGPSGVTCSTASMS